MKTDADPTASVPAPDDIVVRLRTPSTGEDTMEVWDRIRAILLDDDRGSLPREIFESILDSIDEERADAAVEIETLRSRLDEARAQIAAEGRQ